MALRARGRRAARGLERCSACDRSRGECLDPAFQEHYGEDVVVPVSCRCENWNRCARCHQTFEPYRLDANFYEPTDGKIWYVPPLCALDHRCPVDSRAI